MADIKKIKIGNTEYNIKDVISGYITGINSSDVTTALGYTPYNSSNPSGYTSNVGTVTSVNNTTPDASGNVTLTIPQETFYAEYNVATYQQVLDAHNAEKVVFTIKDNNIYYLSNYDSDADVFLFVSNKISLNSYIVLYTGSVWGDMNNYSIQEKLTSGTNIKTINNNSILGSGNISISVPTKISDLTDDTSTNPIDKADTLTGLTASITELNYTDGVTSNIQTQLNGKASTSDISNMVTTDTTQTISGTKTFSNGLIKISNSNGGASFQTTDGINFLRRSNDGTLVLIGRQGSGILLKPNGDNDSTTQTTIGSDGTITSPKFSGVFEGTSSVQSDSAGYNRINYYNNLSYDASNFTEHGTVVVTDGVASNFSTTNYLYTNETLPTTYNTFELYLGKYTFSSWANEWLFTNAIPITTGGVMIRPDTSASNAKIRLWLSSSSSWDIASSVDGTIQHINDLNKAIELKLTFDGSKYTLYSNVENAGWQIEREITSSAKIVGGLPFYFGGVQNNVNHTADLKAFKIIADGNLIFTGEQVGTATYNLSGSAVNIPYKVTPIGRIVDSAYRTNLSSVLSTYGYVPYYTIDTTNSNYTLPQGEIYGVTTMMAKQAIQDS